MKTRTRSRLLALLLVLVMVMTLLPTAAFAADAKPVTATKVTSAPEDWSGEYLLVYEDGNCVLDGSLEKIDDVNNTKAAQLNNGTATADATAVVTVEKVEGGYVMKTASGYYLYTPSDKNALAATQNKDTAASHPLTLSIGKDGETDIVSEAAHMRFNAATDQMRFRFYKSSTYANQQAVALYKVGEAEPAEVSHFVTDLAELKDGDQVIVYNPGSGMALSQAYNGFYNTGVALKWEDDQLTGYEDTEVWTIGVNEDGSYTFSTADGKKFAMGDSFSSTPLDEANPDWTISDAATEGCFYVQNVVRELYLEWYADKGNWSAYKTITDTTETLFAHQIYKVIPTEEPEEPDTIFADGDRVVIYNPANMKALSQNYTGNYNAGVDVTMTGDVLSGYAASEVWTVGVNADGTYTFSTADGKKLSMGASYASMPLDEANPNWKVSEAKTAGCYYIQNTVRGNYIEWFTKYGNWSSYGSINDEPLFAQAFYKVEGDIPTPPAGGLPDEGDRVVIYNQNAQGVLAAENDTQSIENAPATVSDGKAVPGNGGVVFTVKKNGEYYRFENETYGYLCSNGTGNNAFYSKDFSEAGVTAEDADWLVRTCSGGVGGYEMESRTAKFNGKYSQWMEYYSDSYKTFSMDPKKVTDYTIYSFYFYPVDESVTVIDGLVDAPEIITSDSLPTAYVGKDYELNITVHSIFAIDDPWIEYSVKDQNGNYLTEKTADEVDVEVLTPNFSGGKTDAVITVFDTAVAKAGAKGGSMIVTLSFRDVKGIVCVKEITIPVIDAPVIDDVTPANGSETGAEKKPVISAEIANAGENPTVVMTVNGAEVEAVYENGTVSYTPAEDMTDGRVSVTVTVTRADGKASSKSWSFTVGESQYQLYFGQLHSHTTYSDGSGTLDAALDYVANLPEDANVDFVAFTDHSNYFDTKTAANPEGALYDMSLASAYSQETWAAYKKAAADFNASQSDIVALAGFEMTWSGGPGHINTFNTPGIVSRNNTTLNNKTSDAGMKAYYALLSQPEGADSLSQFNHPGSTFGTFSDFSYWDALIDSRIFMVEVGNGEGQIGAGGYYPSYEYYTMALDKGWHVAPTNNQDNHKGKWGNANDARDVILTDDFSEQGLYDAIRALRMYATEDKNLELTYTVNDLPLGSSLTEVPDKLDIRVQVSDPDAADAISKVEVIVNSGKVAYTWDNAAALAAGDLSCTLDPDYSYYYIRVTEADGDLAVTAPVWVGEMLKLGISGVECGTAIPVTGEALELTTTLFNSEATDATVKSVTYTTNGSVVLGTDAKGYTIPANGTLEIPFQYTPDAAKVMTVTVTAVVEQDGKEYTFSMDVTLDVQDADKLVYIGIDASHHNEYVAGNYSDSMGNFSALAAGYSVRTVQLGSSEDLIAACSNEKYKAIILTAPSRRNGTALRDPYDTYSDAEITALAAFNNNGGTVVLCGWGDFYESYASFPAEDHMAAQQNKILAALGSSLRISDDETKDDTWNGGQSQRLYLSTYNFDSFLLSGVEYDAENPHNNLYTELYSQYGGASIYTVDASGAATSTVPETVTPVVFGFDTTYSADDDGDGYGGLGSVPKYNFDGAERLMVMATEQLDGKGLIVVSGAAFLSNFEVQAKAEDVDSGAEKNYSNYTICENLVQHLNPVTVTDIAEVLRQTAAGYKYTIEGVVTSNASGYDKDTAFFDCIYVQDATGGVCCFPVAGKFQIGDKVRVTGTTDFYQGEMELQVTSIEKIGDGEPVQPTEATAAQINDGSVRGSLVTLRGTVQSFDLANGLVQTILVKDAAGNVARVFIDGYITTAKDVEKLAVGAEITVTGLASYDDTFNAPDGPFARIRVRDRADVVCGGVHKCAAFTDIDMWAHDSICFVAENDIMNGMSATTFEPNLEASRAMMVMVLYRMADEPDVSGLDNPFADVAAGAWYADAVVWAASTGITLGKSATEFVPEDDVTRAEMAVFLMRYAALKEQDVTQRAALTDFTDAASVPAWAVEAMQWAVAEGLVNGMGDGTIKPNGCATRAQIATILQRYLNQ